MSRDSAARKALEDMRAVRKGDVSRIHQIQVKDESLYDEVTEAEFVKRMMNNPETTHFVVADGDDQDEDSDDSDNEQEDGQGKSKRRKKSGSKKKKSLNDEQRKNAIDKLLQQQIADSTAKGKEKEAEDSNFLNAVLQQVDNRSAMQTQSTSASALSGINRKPAGKLPDRLLMGAASEIQQINSTLAAQHRPSYSAPPPVRAANTQPVQLAPVDFDTDMENQMDSAPIVKAEPTGTEAAPVLPRRRVIGAPSIDPNKPLASAPAPTASLTLSTSALLSPMTAKVEAKNSPSVRLENPELDWSNVSLDTKVAEPEVSEEMLAATATESTDALGTHTMNMYWLDIYEDQINQPGQLYLFGKTVDPVQKKTVSCCVHFKNLERCMFVLPRPFRVTDPRNPEATQTTEAVDMAAVHAELSSICDKLKIERVRMKPVQRNYAFDKRAEGVPEHAQYLKIKYPAKFPALARELTGHTFSHVFGTKSSCTELLLVKRSMMGPCWITLTHLTKPQQASTFCKVEYVLESLKHMEDQFIPDPNDPEAPPKKTRVSVKHVNRMENAPDAPPLNVLSLHIQTIHNTKKHHHEVVAISAVSHRAVSIDGPTSDFKSVSAFTAVRKIEGQAFPPDLPLQIQQKQRPIELCNNEAALLNFFLAKVQNLDPDVLVGHGLHGFPMEVLMSRFDACNAVLPTRIGRLQRRNLMQRFKGAKGKAGARFSYADVAAGRLVMDTEISAKELVHEKTYTLTELAKTQLKITRDELDAAIVPYLFGTSFDIMDRLVKRCETDAWLTLQLMFKLMIVPLTKQLTELCGNLWARSLQAQRAERNEYLLLHKFHSLKYICPDKLSFAERQEAIASKRDKAKASKAAAAKSLKRKAAAEQAEAAAGEDGAAIPDAEELQADMPPEEEDFEVAGDDDDDDAEATNSRGRRKKPAYSGGLVLEPKKGFYDKIVLVLDFNSLYPSIIQEYNLCFTTVEHWRVNEQGVPEVPPTGRANGVLPRVLRTLVERRRAVKGLLKSERDPIKAAQLEIKQKAFKLVANSMYGCLGFGSSRFCCMPIAALITAQGRDILQRTVDLVQGSLSLNVIYGDTDSLFVYTNTNDVREARDIGGRIKRDVNKLYKLLEIDLDHVFKSLLLLKKKKYAALVDEGDGSAPHIESKGLDLVRRDWCDLSKDLGNIVLQEVMSGRSAEDIVDSIHGHLRQLSDDIRANRIPLQKFIINKGLTKNPADYPDAKNQPHVQVALAMLKAGKAVKSGDFVPYVICIDQANPDNVGGGLLGARAHHPDAVMASNGALTVDTRWYLSNQVLPPIVRLCDPIQGTDAAQIAECLGLDSSKFSHFTSQPSEMEIDELAPSLDNVLDDDERFKECAPLLLSCRHCNAQNVPFAGVFARTPPPKGYAPNQPDMSLIRSGLHCGTAGCPGFVCQSPSCRPLDINSLMTRLQLARREYILRSEQLQLRCNDPTCGWQTSLLPVRRSSAIMQQGGNSAAVNGTLELNEAPCPNGGCRGGRLKPQYTSLQLHTQLWHLSWLFDQKRAVRREAAEFFVRRANPQKESDNEKKSVEAEYSNQITLADKEVLDLAHSLMEQFRKQSLYQFVGKSFWDTAFHHLLRKQ